MPLKNFLFQVSPDGNQTSKLIVESLVGFDTPTTRQNGWVTAAPPRGGVNGGVTSAAELTVVSTIFRLERLAQFPPVTPWALMTVPVWAAAESSLPPLQPVMSKPPTVSTG